MNSPMSSQQEKQGYERQKEISWWIFMLGPFCIQSIIPQVDTRQQLTGGMLWNTSNVFISIKSFKYTKSWKFELLKEPKSFIRHLK